MPQGQYMSDVIPAVGHRLSSGWRNARTTKPTNSSQIVSSRSTTASDVRDSLLLRCPARRRTSTSGLRRRHRTQQLPLGLTRRTSPPFPEHTYQKPLNSRQTFDTQRVPVRPRGSGGFMIVSSTENIPHKPLKQCLERRLPTCCFEAGTDGTSGLTFNSEIML